MSDPPKQFIRTVPSVVLPLLAAALAIYPLLPPGIPSTADGPLHLIRTVEFDAVLRSGVLYPRWAPDLAFGYGYPLFNYYAPLFYYIAEIPHLLGASFELAFKLTIYLAFILYALAMYWWTRPFLGDTPAAVAGVAYVYVPFRFHEAYMQGDYPQFLALALAPLALGALDRFFAVERLTARHVLVLTLALGAILLIHNISALWLAPTLAGYVVVVGGGGWVLSARGTGALRAKRHRSWSEEPHLLASSQAAASPAPTKASPEEAGRTLEREQGAAATRLLSAAGSALLAIGLTAFFWLPALAEQNLVQLYRLRTDDYDVRHSFITLATLFAPPAVVDQTAANPPPFLHLGWGQVALALATLPLLALLIRRVLTPDPASGIFGKNLGKVALRATFPRLKPTYLPWFRASARRTAPKLVGTKPPREGDLVAKPRPAIPDSRFSPIDSRVVAHLVFGWLLLIGSATMTLPISLPVWRRIPLIAYTQFPWRVLELSGIATALLAGLAVHLALRLTSPGSTTKVSESRELQSMDPTDLDSGADGVRPATVPPRRHDWLATTIVAVALLILLVPSLVYLYPRQPFLVYGRLTPADVTGFERNGGAVGTTSTGEYYPLDVQDRPTAPLPPDVATAGRLDRRSLPPGARITFLGSAGYSERYALTLPGPATLRFNLIRFAGWQVSIDGQTVPTRPSPRQGLLEFDVPAGSHQVALDFADTPIRRLGWALSAVSLALLAGTLLVTRKLASRATGQPSRSAESLGAAASEVSIEPPRLAGKGASATGASSSPLQRGWRVPGSEATVKAPVLTAATTRFAGVRPVIADLDPGAIAIPATILLVLIALRVTSPAPYTTVFARRSPLDHVVGVTHPARVRLEDKVEFLGYDLSGETVKPGGTITVTLYWRALQPLQSDYRSLAMIARVGDKGLLAQDDRVHPGGIPTHTWPTDRYFIDEHTISIPADAPPMVYQLQVALYDPRTLAHLRQDGVSGWEGEQIVLQQIHVVRSSPVEPSSYHSLGEPVFGGVITLVGYRLNTDRFQPGQTIELTLIWRANRRIDHDYTVFTHLIDANQNQAAGHDSMPLNGQYPTSDWLIGEEIVDSHPIALPANLPPGRYHLAFGLYDAKTLQRLDATAKGWSGPRSQIDLDDVPIQVGRP